MGKFREGLAYQSLVQSVRTQTIRTAHFTHVDVSIESEQTVKEKRKERQFSNVFVLLVMIKGHCPTYLRGEKRSAKSSGVEVEGALE